MSKRTFYIIKKNAFFKGSCARGFFITPSNDSMIVHHSGTLALF